MVYFVEDDSSIRELVVYTLKNTGLDACGFACGKDFWDAYNKQSPDLVLLDIMLPDEDGLSILKKLRALSSDLPIMMITAKGTEYDKVLGFDIGADDYLAKPFGMMEMLARVKSLLRRANKDNRSESLIKIGELEIDKKTHIVKVSGEATSLTLKEFELLYMLMKNVGIVLMRDQILESIWGYDFDGETRTLDVHIQTLRSKLSKCGKMIKTVRGVGYKLEEDK